MFPGLLTSNFVVVFVAVDVIVVVFVVVAVFIIIDIVVSMSVKKENGQFIFQKCWRYFILINNVQLDAAQELMKIIGMLSGLTLFYT